MEQLLIYLFKSSCCIAITYAVFRTFLSRLTFFELNRAAILVLLAVSLIIPILNLPLATPLQSTSSYLFQNGINTQLNSSQLLFEEPESTTSFLGWLTTIYLIGFSFSLLILCYQLYLANKQINKSTVHQYGPYQLAIHPSYQYSSFFNYIFLPKLPDNNPEIKQALMHECIHVDKLHSLDVLFLALCKTVFWFHPFIYLLDKNLKENHEFEADKIVSGHYTKSQYSRLLVELAANNKTLALMHNFNYSPIKKRIIMMNKKQSKSMQKVRFLLLVPIMAAMSLLFSFGNSADQSYKLSGTWIGTEMEFEQAAGPDIKAMIEGGKSLHVDGKLVLNKDSHYQIEDPEGNINGEGKWESTNGNSFTTTAENGETTNYKVVKLDRNQLVTEHQVQMETPKGEVKGKIVLYYKR